MKHQMQENKQEISVFWFRRDLRLEDNHGLYQATKSGFPVLPLFIFDEEITGELPVDDARITFIYDVLSSIRDRLHEHGSSLYVIKDKPHAAWKKITEEFNVKEVYANEDYEPYAINRDLAVQDFLASRGIPLTLLKDQVIFEKDEVVKADGNPYTVYTPYRNKWMELFRNAAHAAYADADMDSFVKLEFAFPDLDEIGFSSSAIKVPAYQLDRMADYAETRNTPSVEGTSRLGPYLRFGTIGIRSIVEKTKTYPVFLGELIWREFFMQILYYFPNVVDQNFRSKYDGIVWRNNEEEFEKWKKGETGYPIVDAGMRELNTTGFMHNRVRMIAGSFLCKHLLIDWKWGEAYFAQKLLDYELSSNNGNWQWVAGTGCDAAPYFRVFNPTAQQQKFDPKMDYINKWVPELDSPDYPAPMIEHKFARERAIDTYKAGIS